MESDGAAPIILIVGDSLSAGYGIDARQAWPVLLGKRLGEQGYQHEVVNASISGETTAGGARRIAARLESHNPAIVVLALGANDGLRGIAPDEIKRNLSRLYAAVSDVDAVMLMLKVRVPPNYGPQYTSAFEAVFDDFAAAHDLIYGPFMLKQFAIKIDAFQSDGLHPTSAMQPVILNTLWPSLLDAIRESNESIPSL